MNISPGKCLVVCLYLTPASGVSKDGLWQPTCPVPARGIKRRKRQRKWKRGALILSLWIVGFLIQVFSKVQFLGLANYLPQTEAVSPHRMVLPEPCDTPHTLLTQHVYSVHLMLLLLYIMLMSYTTHPHPFDSC